VKYQRAERGVLLPDEVAGILGFMGTRTARLRLAASTATPIKPGAEYARASLAATQAVRDQALVALLLTTGLRSGELRALRWGSIDMSTGPPAIH
jgi:integrase